jgi:hypothetical protein
MVVKGGEGLGYSVVGLQSDPLSLVFLALDKAGGQLVEGTLLLGEASHGLGPAQGGGEAFSEDGEEGHLVLAELERERERDHQRAEEGFLRHQGEAEEALGLGGRGGLVESEVPRGVGNCQGLP